MGVSTSRKPSSWRTSRIAIVTALRATNRCVISGRRRSRYRYLSLRSSDALMPSSIGNGGVSARFRIVRAVARTSIPPVGRSAFTASAPRAMTAPVTSTTNSLRSSLARARTAASGRNSASKTTWARPERSRRSMKTSSPWSRRRLTHPWRRTVCPTCEGRRVPAGVRERADMAGILQTRAERLDDSGPRQLLLRTRLQRLEDDGPRRAFLLAEEKGERRTRALGVLEAGAGALRGRHEVHGDAGAAQLARERERVGDVRPVERDERHAAHGRDGRGAERLGEHVHEPVLADGEPDAGRLRAAQVRDELVVPPAAEERVLRAEAGGSDLEDGAGVVIEPPDETGLDSVRNPRRVEKTKELRVMFGRLLRKVIDHARQRGVGEPFRELRVLRIEDAQRVFLEAPPVVRVEQIHLRRKPGAQRLDEPRSLLLGPHGIQRHGEAREAEPPEEVEQHDEDFGVRRRVRRP